MPAISTVLGYLAAFVVGNIFGIFVSSIGTVSKLSDLQDELWDKDREILDLKGEIASLRQQLLILRNTPLPVRGL